MNKLKPMILRNSLYWRWIRLPSPSNCLNCILLDGRIFGTTDTTQRKPPLHPGCACHSVTIPSILVGTATIQNINGADWYLKHLHRLPDYYISKEDAKTLGWIPILGNLSQVAPGKMIGGTKFHNKRNILPNKVGRIWYEADINYMVGFRNSERILYSNDGLIFVTYDHYKTFYHVN